jgi:hypothetical protein
MPEAHPVDNRVAVLVLQHPQEQDRVLGTAKLLCATLANATLTIGLSWRNLGHALGTPAEARDWGVLYLGSTHAAKQQGPLVALDGKSQPLADQASARAGSRARCPGWQLGAGQGAVVAQRLAHAAAPLRGRARRPVAVWRPAPRGAAGRMSRRSKRWRSRFPCSKAMQRCERSWQAPLQGAATTARAAGIRDSKRDRRRR